MKEEFVKRRSRYSEQLFTIYLTPNSEKLRSSETDLKYFFNSQMNIKLSRESLGRGKSVIYNFKRLGKFVNLF